MCEAIIHPVLVSHKAAAAAAAAALDAAAGSISSVADNDGDAADAVCVDIVVQLVEVVGVYPAASCCILPPGMQVCAAILDPILVPHQAAAAAAAPDASADGTPTSANADGAADTAAGADSLLARSAEERSRDAFLRVLLLVDALPHKISLMMEDWYRVRSLVCWPAGCKITLLVAQQDVSLFCGDLVQFKYAFSTALPTTYHICILNRVIYYLYHDYGYCLPHCMFLQVLEYCCCWS
jgi:hypothetical protein